MQLVDAYDGDDNRSMAANNSSAYNCRTVAGQSSFSAHAYGAAVDINPVENPYVTADGVLPPAGRRFVDVDRSADAKAARGVIVADDVRRARLRPDRLEVGRRLERGRLPALPRALIAFVGPAHLQKRPGQPV